MSFDFDLRRPAWLVVNEQGVLLGSSREAGELLSRQSGLQQTIREWSRAWVLAIGSGNVPDSMIAGDERTPQLLLEATPLNASSAAVASAAARQLLLLISIKIQPQHDPARPESKFTPAEQRVAALIAEGLPPREIARQLALSVHTVRSHLKRLLAKTGVHSQAALVRTLLAGRSAHTVAESQPRAFAATQGER